MNAQPAATAKQLATDYVTKREAMRQAKRQQKAVERQRARLRAEMSAKAWADEQEKAAETLAPKVLRDPIVMPSGQMLVGPRVTVIGGRAVRFDSITTILKYCRASEVQKLAIKLLLADWSDVGAGIGVGAVDWLRFGGGSGGADGANDAIDHQITARGRLEGALTFLGAFTGIVSRVVFDGIPLSAYAEEISTEDDPRTVDDAQALLRRAMSRLVMFYWPPVDRPVQCDAVLVFGPARAAYSIGVDAG